MIITNCKNLKRYLALNEGFKKINEFISKNDMNKIEKGRYELGDGDYVNVFEPNKVAKDFKFEKMEAHKKYIDVQYVIKGEETLYYDFSDNLKPITEYDENDDYFFGVSDNAKLCLVKEGDFMILFPEDGHYAMISGGEEIGKKAVFKIKVR